MTEPISTKPYLVRAIHEWCVDAGYTPHIVVAVDSQTRVPMAYVKDGEIVLNLNYAATKDLHIDNELITFSARFGGVSQNLYVPMQAVKGIFARETGQGMFFEPESVSPVSELNDSSEKAFEPELDVQKQKNIKKPTLTIVK